MKSAVAIKDPLGWYVTITEQIAVKSEDELNEVFKSHNLFRNELVNENYKRQGINMIVAE
jgi:hypothetical protein